MCNDYYIESFMANWMSKCQMTKQACSIVFSYELEDNTLQYMINATFNYIKVKHQIWKLNYAKKRPYL